MNKILIIALVIWFLVIGGIFAYTSFVRNTGTQVQVEPTSVPASNPTPITDQTLRLWKDTLGFTFSYPTEMLIDPHNEDQDNFAHLEITSPFKSGNITIWAKDTKYSNVTDWVTSDPTAGAGNPVETTLDGTPAKKIFYDSPKKIVTATIYDGLLFSIEGNFSGNSTLASEYDTIVANFSFSRVKAVGQQARIVEPTQSLSSSLTPTPVIDESAGTIVWPEEIIN